VVGLSNSELESLRRDGFQSTEWREVFGVQELASGEAVPARSEVRPEPGALLSGRYAIEADRVVFIPSEPLQGKRSYRVAWQYGESPGVTATLSPERDGVVPEAVVLGVYPSGDLLPANLSRFHLDFSEPMGEGPEPELAHIHLLDGKGHPVPLGEGVETRWNEKRDRLTVELGDDPPLRPGDRYQLLIDRHFTDNKGRHLLAGSHKLFLIEDPDRRTTRPEDWTLTAPASEQAPLTVDFLEPLDFSTLDRALEVVDHKGATVAGSVRISNGETFWIFVPRQPWSANGSYRLNVARELEDPAGNPVTAGGGGSVLSFKLEGATNQAAAAETARRSGSGQV
jgi:hypothetical protein